MDIELTPSVAPVVAPSEETKTDPAEVVETPAADPVVEPELFKMPDGRMLTGAQVKDEYEKLLPDYTQKSQRLAELTRNTDPSIPEWKKEGYTPKSYGELVELGKAEAIKEITAQATEKARVDAEIAANIDSQLAAIKAKDPKVDEGALFTHANKYGFRDLGLAYQNMSEMKTVARVVEERVLKGAVKKVDPIATGGGSGQGSAPRYNPNLSPQEFLAQLKKS